jgi:hypothetical protein
MSLKYVIRDTLSSLILENVKLEKRTQENVLQQRQEYEVTYTLYTKRREPKLKSNEKSPRTITMKERKRKQKIKKKYH